MSNETQPPAPPPRYWCYHCDKRVTTQTLSSPTDLICSDCRHGFVESIPVVVPSSPPQSSEPNDPTHLLGQQFYEVLRLLSEELNDEENGNIEITGGVTPPVEDDPVDVSDEGDDFLRFNLEGWDDDDDDDDDDEGEADGEGEEDEDVNGFTEVSHGEVSNIERVGNMVERDGGRERVRVGEQSWRHRHDVLRLRIRDFAARAGGLGGRGRREGETGMGEEGARRNRILDWSEILMGLEDTAIELSIEMPEGEDGYVGNPEDYVDAAGYETLLQNLAESDNGGRRGAPPASSNAVNGLKKEVVSVEEGDLVCAICKDVAEVGEMATKMPCGHGYHEECIVAWLGARNSCPICRFELETDDVEYEERRRIAVTTALSSNSGRE